MHDTRRQRVRLRKKRLYLTVFVKDYVFFVTSYNLYHFDKNIQNFSKQNILLSPFHQQRLFSKFEALRIELASVKL